VPAALVTTALLPIVAREFFARDTGSEYGVGLPWKLKFLAVTIRNNIRVERYLDAKDNTLRDIWHDR